MQMIERVARACYRNAYPDVREDDLNFDGLHEPRHELHMNMAIAAIKAIRDVTDTMNNAGNMVGDYPWDGKRPTRIFQAMLDAALQEGKEMQA